MTRRAYSCGQARSLLECVSVEALSRAAETTTWGERRVMVRLGRYAEGAGGFGQGAGLSDARIVLERAGALVVQGHMNDAAPLLDASLVGRWPAADEWALVAMERAGLRVVRELDVAGALDQATTIVDAARLAQASTVLLARLDRTWARVVFAALIYGEVTEEIGQAATERLEAAVEALTKAGESEESLLVRMLALSSRIDRPWSRQEGITQDAIAAGLPSIAADALMHRAWALRRD